MPELTLATLNLHWGRDRSGRVYDVVGVCRRLDADVIVLEEAFSPDPCDTAPPGGPPAALEDPPGVAQLAARLGYASALAVPFARAALHHRPRPPGLLGRLAGRPVAVGRLDPPRPARPRRERTKGLPDRDACQGMALRSEPKAARRGSLGLALLARVPLGPARLVELGRLPGDGVARSALAVSVFPATSPIEVVAAHLSHLSHGSLLQLRRLRRALPPPTQPVLVAGDLNMWGPLVEAALPGLRRAVVGRTWPSHRPHSQIDHVLVSPVVEVRDAAILDDVGSDHRPVRVRVRWG